MIFFRSEPWRAARWGANSSGDQAGGGYAWPQGEWATASRLLGHAGRIIGLGFADKEKQLLSASDNGVVRWWDLPLVLPREIVQQDPVVSSLLLGKDGTTTIVGAGEAGARLVNAVTGEAIRLLEGQQGAVTSVTLSALRSSYLMSGGAGCPHA